MGEEKQQPPVPWHRDGRLAFKVIGGITLLVIAVIAVIGGGSSTKKSEPKAGERALSRGDLAPWPFSSESGMLRCRRASAVTFQPAGGVEYGLNGPAQTMGYPRVDSIWVLDPALGNGLKVDISSVLSAGLALC